MKKKSLTFKIFTSIFSVGTLIYLICAVLFISNTYSYFEKQIFSELETEVSLLQHYAETNRTSELAELKTKNRITLIHPDGTVYFDNTVNALTLENHSMRSEFIGAIQNGTDSSRTHVRLGNKIRRFPYFFLIIGYRAFKNGRIVL